MIRCCECGHAEEDHGHNPKLPGSTACLMGSTDEDKDAMEDDCECISFSWDGGDDAEKKDVTT